MILSFLYLLYFPWKEIRGFTFGSPFIKVSSARVGIKQRRGRMILLSRQQESTLLGWTVKDDSRCFRVLTIFSYWKYRSSISAKHFVSRQSESWTEWHIPILSEKDLGFSQWISHIFSVFFFVFLLFCLLSFAFWFLFCIFLIFFLFCMFCFVFFAFFFRFIFFLSFSAHYFFLSFFNLWFFFLSVFF